MDKKGDLRDFESGIVVDANRAGLFIFRMTKSFKSCQNCQSVIWFQLHILIKPWGKVQLNTINQNNKLNNNTCNN